MRPFEAFYGIRWNTPVSWDNIEYREVVVPELLKEMEEKMSNIKKNLKIAHVTYPTSHKSGTLTSSPLLD
jgi:hypothetical protein